MEMLQRLEDILQGYYPNKSKMVLEREAKHLISKGVVALPLKIGADVYCLAQPCGGCECFNEPMKEEFIERCRQCDKWEIIKCKFDWDLVPEWRKTVFPTEEEAKRRMAKIKRRLRERICKIR